MENYLDYLDDDAIWMCERRGMFQSAGEMEY